VPILGLCARCSELSSQLVAVRSWVVFDGPVRQAIHRIKYNRDLALAGIFANYLGSYFLNQLNWSVEMIVPVPLSRRRKKSRGYNQAALLAKPLARELDLPYTHQALRRVRETRSQVGLSLIERRINVADVFRAFPIVMNKNILIVDDVATSGSTLEACANALKHAGAKAVYGLTLARAVL
jgi:ComF family protein